MTSQQPPPPLPPSHIGLIVGGRPLMTNPTTTIQPDPTIPPRSWIFRFPAQPTFSHITVFMDPSVPLAPGIALAVYISLPPPSLPSASAVATAAGQQQQQQQEYIFMGALSNEKPSAVYKVNIRSQASQLQPREQAEQDLMMDVDADHQVFPVPAAGADIEIGLQLEPAVQVAQRIAALEEQKAVRRKIRARGDVYDQQGASSSSSTGTATTGTATGRGVGAAPATAATLKAMGLKIAQDLFNYLSGFAVHDGIGGRGDVVPMDAFRRWWDKFQVRVENDPEYLIRDAE